LVIQLRVAVEASRAVTCDGDTPSNRGPTSRRMASASSSLSGAKSATVPDSVRAPGRTRIRFLPTLSRRSSSLSRAPLAPGPTTMPRLVRANRPLWTSRAPRATRIAEIKLIGVPQVAILRPRPRPSWGVRTADFHMRDETRAVPRTRRLLDRAGVNRRHPPVGPQPPNLPGPAFPSLTYFIKPAGVTAARRL